jgi:uncharacterized protein with PIN domain
VLRVIRFHLDENVSNAVANGLRQRGIDVTTPKDAELIGATDEEQLAFSTSHQRVIFTHDHDFLRLASQGLGHAGIVYSPPRRRAIGQIVLSLALLHRRKTPENMQDHVEYI